MSANPNGVPEQLATFLQRNPIHFKVLAPGVPMPTVPAAAAAIGVPENQILKTLLFVGKDGQYVVAIACGTRRVSRDILAEVSGVHRPRPAGPDAVASVTGYPAGGVAPIGLPEDVPVIVDTSVAALPVAYGGAGREDLLLRIDPRDVIRLNRAQVASIVESD
jgi:Cys-tRNA(Pro) deacylase